MFHLLVWIRILDWDSFRYVPFAPDDKISISKLPYSYHHATFVQNPRSCQKALKDEVKGQLTKYIALISPSPMDASPPTTMELLYKEETFIKILIEYLSRQSFLVCSKSFYETDLDQISIRTGEFSVEKS